MVVEWEVYLRQKDVGSLFLMVWRKTAVEGEFKLIGYVSFVPSVTGAFVLKVRMNLLHLATQYGGDGV